ncbi:MAG: glycosyltransferase [Patescibacteria group bacterium]
MNVLVYYAPFGGGHKAASKILLEIASQCKANNLQLKEFDITQNTGIVTSLISLFYRGVATKYTRLWAITFYLTQNRLVINVLQLLLAIKLIPGITDALKKHKPDLIITTYFIGWFLKHASKLMGSNIKIITLVTDPFDVHPVWINSSSDMYIFESQKAFAEGCKLGLSESTARIISPLVKSQFSRIPKAANITKYKESFDLQNNYRTILLVGGAEGLKDGDRIMIELIKRYQNVNIVVVCGKNQVYREKCDSIKASYFATNVLVIGYSTQMYELMSIADLVITKAGPGIIFEAVSLRKPILVSSYLWRQELGVKEYIVENSLGYYTPDISQLLQKVDLVLSNQHERQKIQSAYSDLNFQPGNKQMEAILEDLSTDY